MHVTQENIKNLLEVFSSQTKTHIISLLAMKGKMTVTQLSKYIKTSRSNLYQSVSDLQRMGLINPPEVVVKKNYVEKYYTLNDEAINEISSEGMEQELKSMPPERIRELLATFLLTQSMNLRVIAQEVANASDEDIMRALSENNRDSAAISFGSFTRRTYENALEKLKPYLEFVDNPENFRNNKEKGEEEKNLVLLLAIPEYIISPHNKDKKI